MKNVILSADGDDIVYSVPDKVADNLKSYCIQFESDWLQHSPEAQKYRTKGIICFNEADFIEYLNRYLFPDEQSKFVKNLGRINCVKDYPEEYKHCPSFNF